MESNATSSPTPEAEASSFDGFGLKVGRTVILSLLMIVLITGNLLVIVIFKRTSRIRNNTNYFIVNASASELILTFPWPIRIIHIWLGGDVFLLVGPLGEFLCKMVMFYSDIYPAVAIQSLVLITVERFVVVMHPQKSRRFTPRLRTVLIIVTWIVAALLHLPYFYFLRIESKCGRPHFCIREWTPFLNSEESDRIFYTFMVSVFIYFPLILTTLLYTLISFKLRKRDFPGAHLEDSSEDIRRFEHNKRIIKMSICFVIVFAVSWLPLSAFWLMVNYSRWPINCFFELTVFHLALMSSAINPLILFYYNRNFRQGLKKLLVNCCRCVLRRSNSENTVNMELQEINRGKRSNSAVSSRRKRREVTWL